MNKDDVEEEFFALTIKIGLLNKEDLFKIGISEDEYFNPTDNTLWKIESYYKKNKKR